MRYVTTVFSAIILFLSACRKEPALVNSSGGSGGTGASFSAVIDGKSWIPLDSSVFASMMNGAITLSGTGSGDRMIAISLDDTIPGTYSLGLNTASSATYTDSNTFIQYFATNQGTNASLAGGKVVVTAIDKVNKTLTGSFSFNVFNDSAGYKKAVTQGVFNNLPYITSLPLAKSTDTFSVQVNGVAWTPPSISVTIVAGEVVVKGSETDDSRSLGIVMPKGIAAACGYRYPFEWGIWGAYTDAGQSYSSVKITPVQGGLTEYYIYPGWLGPLEDNPATRRLRVHFNFQAATPTGSSSVQISTGYLSVQYPNY